MICQKCKAENQDTAIFCKDCGEKLQQEQSAVENNCPNCEHSSNPSDAVFCEQCGNSIEPEEWWHQYVGYVNCTNCGHSNTSDAMFCEQCRNKIPQKPIKTFYLPTVLVGIVLSVLVILIVLMLL